MTDFFEPPPPPPEPEPYARQPWFGPPDNVVGAGVPIELILARTDDLALSLERFAAYPSGFGFSLVTRTRTEEIGWDLDQAFFGRPYQRRTYEEGKIPPQRLRFGIQFADGSKATNLQVSLGGPDEEPAGPILMGGGGGGGGRRWDQDYWVWPLPPAGQLAFVCEWPAYGIPFTRVEIEAERIFESAPRAEVLWSDSNGNSQSGGAWRSLGPR